MTRLFTFGCSFTEYKWPTWADILGREFDYFENWGRTGAGNSFIFNSLIECAKRNNITKDDTVIIMWTSIAREDRWTSERGWITPGSIYNQSEYDRNFVKTFADPIGYLIRDLATISGTKQILESLGCQWQFLSMVPLNYYNDSVDEFDNQLIINKNVLELYKDDLLAIKPSVYEVVFNNDWYSRPVPSTESETEYNILKGNDWPSWQDFNANILTNISDKIKTEIKEKFFKKNIRMDTHPTPQEHLLYLDALNFAISASTRKWIKEYNNPNWKTTKPRIRF